MNLRTNCSPSLITAEMKYFCKHMILLYSSSSNDRPTDKVIYKVNVRRSGKFYLKQSPQGPPKLSSLKSLKIQNPPPILDIYVATPAEMAFFLYKILGGKTVKNVQIRV